MIRFVSCSISEGELKMSENSTEVFNIEDTFQVDDYMYFYSQMLTDEISGRDVDFLVEQIPVNPSDHILDIPCGFGRHSNRLARHAASVTGVDIQEGFIDIARKDALRQKVKCRYIAGDMRELDFKGEFDIALSLFTSFGYFDDETNQKVLQKIAKALKKGGRFCIETINRDVLLQNLKNCIIQERDGNYMIDSNRYDYLNGRIYTKRIIFRNSSLRTINFSIRLYNPTELQSLLKLEGLKTIKTFPGFCGQDMWGKSLRLLIIAEKFD